MQNIKTKILHYLKEIILFFVIISIFANVLSLYKSSELNKNAFELKQVTLLNQKQYIFQKNKPLLIHFWATWCPVCKAEASNINFISKYFNVITIAVNSGTNQEIQKYMKKNGYTYKVVNDTHGELAKKFNIEGYPTTFIYNKQKTLTFSEVGYTSSIGLYLRLWWSSF